MATSTRSDDMNRLGGVLAFLALVWRARGVWLGLIALGIAFYGGWITEQARTGEHRTDLPPLLGWLLFGLAGLLLVFAVLPVPALRPAGPSAFLQELRAMKRSTRNWFIALSATALVCALASVPLFWILNQAKYPDEIANNWAVNTGSWMLYIASLLLFGLAFIIWERTARSPVEGDQAGASSDRLPQPLNWAIMLGLFTLAVLVRVIDLENVPPGLWFDEAQNGVVGRQLLAPGAAHPTFIGDATQMGSIYFYLVGLLVNLSDSTMWAVRLLPALSGALIAPMIYVLAARLYGWRVGLAAGGLLAVAAWNITLSRFGVASMPTVALDVAIYLCMAQGLRTGRLGYYAAGGVLMGIALQMYYSSRLVPLVLVVLLAHLLVTERARLIRSIRAGALVFAVGVVLAFLPVGLFVLQKPDIYNARTSAVSIFGPQISPNQEALARNLEHNLKAHALMFNWHGDGNGRHNLNGWPMLDWVTAAMFLAGLASCLLRVWRWQYAFPVLWFLTAMSGGVLSFPFEAPQGHRTIESSVVTMLLAGIFLGEVSQLLFGARSARWVAGVIAARQRRMADNVRKTITQIAWGISAVGLVLALWWIGGMNLHRYFQLQARDISVWKDMNAPQMTTAHAVRHFGASYTVYVTPVHWNQPQTLYLAPSVESLPWSGMFSIPITSTSTSKPDGVVIILDPPSAGDIASIARIYPNARFDILTPPDNPERVLYTIVIPAADIQGLHGVRAAYQSGTAGLQEEILPEFRYDWSRHNSLAGDRRTPGDGTVRLSASLKVDNFGSYLFEWETPGSGQLLVDGYRVTAGHPITLASGLHSLEVTDTVTSKTGVSRLLWSLAEPDLSGSQVSSALRPVDPDFLFEPDKVEPHGLTGLYKPGLDFSAPAAVGRVDSIISFYFHVTPLDRPYSAEWSGRILIPEAGTYTFGTEQLDQSTLFIDGKELLVNKEPNTLVEKELVLTAGWHEIQILYSVEGNGSHIHLYWTPPGRKRSVVPALFLWPQLGRYPEVSEIENLPTLDESDGTQLPADRVHTR